MFKTIKLYRQQNGRTPYEEWIEDLKDVVGRAKIRIRVERARLGNFGDYRTIGGGIVELKIDYGPRYGIYMGLYGEEVVVLLCGGDKDSQDKDIVKAHDYWEDYKRRL